MKRWVALSMLLCACGERASTRPAPSASASAPPAPATPPVVRYSHSDQPVLVPPPVFSRDGETVAVGPLLVTRRGKVAVQRMQGMAAAISPDGKRAVFETVTAFGARRPDPSLHAYRDGTSFASTVRWSDGAPIEMGKGLVSNTVIVAEAGGTLEVPGARFSAFSPSGNVALLRGVDGDLLLHEGAREARKIEAPGSSYSLYKFSPDGAWLLRDAGDDIGVVAVAEARHKGRLFSRAGLVRAHFVGANRLVACAERAARLYDVATLEQLKEANDVLGMGGCELSPSGKLIALFGGSEVSVLDTASLARVSSLKIDVAVESIAWAEGDGRLAVEGKGAAVWVHDVATRKSVKAVGQAPLWVGSDTLLLQRESVVEARSPDLSLKALLAGRSFAMHDAATAVSVPLVTTRDGALWLHDRQSLALLGRVSLRDTVAHSTSFGWAGLSASRDHVGFLRWHSDAEDSGGRSSSGYAETAVVARLSDARQLHVRMVAPPKGPPRLVALTEDGRFFADSEALGGFHYIVDGKRDTVAAAELSAALSTPRLIEEFFAAR